jgi:hypothetical protein
VCDCACYLFPHPTGFRNKVLFPTYFSLLVHKVGFFYKCAYRHHSPQGRSAKPRSASQVTVRNLLTYHVCVITNQIYITLNNDFDKYNYFLQWVHSVMNCIDNFLIIRSRFKTQ